MIRKIYHNAYTLIGNPAKILIKEARKMIAESNKEFGFERVALDLAAVQKGFATQNDLTEIAEWHRRCAVEKLALAVSYLRRAERGALKSKFRRYAAMRLKRHEQVLKKFEKNEKADDRNETAKSLGIKNYLKDNSAKAALVPSVF